MPQTTEDSPSPLDLLSKFPEFCLFAKNLNHEVRNPLAVIQSSAELLNIYGQSMTVEQRQALFSTIYDAVDEIKDALPKDCAGHALAQ